MHISHQIACGNATDTANGGQMMSCSYEEKDLNRNKYLNLILNKTPH